jgi:very-short-patch-repair endonuclease
VTTTRRVASTPRIEVDACWRAERIAVELDGWSAHRSRQAGEHDRAKTNFLQLRGWTVLRYTHHQLAAEPQRAAAELRAALAQAGR